MNIELKERSRDDLLEIISAKDMKITMQKIEIKEMKEEIERLNNIINEFDKWLENEIKFQEIVENAHFLRKARIKLQELKGSDKE